MNLLIITRPSRTTYISWALSPERWMFVNADLTLHLARPPVGEWLVHDATTVLGDTGGGMAEGALYDDSGRVARSAQSLVLERRPA